MKKKETDEEKGNQLVCKPWRMERRGKGSGEERESKLTVDSSLKSHVGYGETESTLLTVMLCSLQTTIDYNE